MRKCDVTLDWTLWPAGFCHIFLLAFARALFFVNASWQLLHSSEQGSSRKACPALARILGPPAILQLCFIWPCLVI